MAGERSDEETTSRRWPDPDEGPWLLTLRWARRNGRPVPVGMSLEPATSEAAESVVLMTSTLRDLRIAEVVIEDREQLKYIPASKPEPELQIAGMRQSTVRRLKRTAEIYMAAWSAGEPPTQTVAQRMNITHPAAANLVRRAREAGLLPPTSAGVPQG
ncbi:MAG: hypothetical protein ABW022_14860 [Actinoplanes sp.]